MKCAMWNVKCVMRKSGVSLITVLLFMLVATIAATATYKWITSEGKSSADRMMLSEAREASVAGIKSARTWITYHGNEAGALVKQYFDGNKRPVRLSFLHQFDNGKQDYNVWLVGVDISKPTYKLKLVSTGRGRNGSEYSEISILRVDGLYRLQVPGQKGNADFEEAFYGNLHTAGTINVDKAIITQTPAVHNAGGQALNSITASEYIIMDGNFYGHSATNVKNLYVTGSFGYCDNVTVTGNVYVGGIMYAPMAQGVTIGGSAYLQGGLDLNHSSPLKSQCSGTEGGNITITGNVTMNGPFVYYDNNTSYKCTLESNLVANNGIDFPSTYPSSTDTVKIEGNVYVKDGGGHSSDGSGSRPSDKADRTVFGSSNANKVYVEGFGLQTEGGKTYGVSNDGQIYTTVKGNWTIPSSDEIASWNADLMTDYAEKLTADASNNCTVQQPIQFNEGFLNSSLKHTKDDKMGCDASIWPSSGSYIDGAWVDSVNACYTKAQKQSQLYNDKWLIIETESFNANSGITTKLANHVIWIHNAGSGQALYSIPPTESDAQVVLFLPEGYANASCITTTNGKTYNYFIYSKKNISCIYMNGKISGSVFMANCSVINTSGSNPALNVSTKNTTIIQDISDDDIICAYQPNLPPDETPSCSGGGGAGGGGGGGAAAAGSSDAYFISLAPQLRVELESQYKNNEFDEDGLGNNYSTISPSILVMPRIIYLSRDAYGKLSDYYSLLNLNGAVEEKDPNQVACNPNTIETTDPLYDAENDLGPEKTTYRCTYTSKNGYNNVDFWVVVGDALGLSPEVSLDAHSKEVTPLMPATVSMYVPQAARAKVSVDIRVTTVPSNWTLQPLSGVTPRQVDPNNGSGIYTVEASTNGSKPLFTVSVNSNSETNTSMMFQLIQPCEGCIISNTDNAEEVFMSGYITVERKEASEYCTEESHATDCADQEITEKLDWPSCDEIVNQGQNNEIKWIVPDCLNRTTEDENDKWSCSMGFGHDNYSIKFEMQGNVPEYCEVLLPQGSDNELPKPGTAFVENQTEYLYASIVRKKKTLYVGVNGATTPTITVESYGLQPYDPVNQTQSPETVTCTAATGSSYSSYYSCPVYAGDHIRLVLDKKGRDDFSYWKATGQDFSSSQTIYPTDGEFVLPVITGNNTVIAYFGEVDDRCFYENFREISDENGSNYMCASNSKADCFYSCSGGSCYSSVSSVDADWRRIFEQYGNLDISGGSDVSNLHEVKYLRNQDASGTLTHTGAGPGTTADDNFFALHRVEAGMDGILSATFATSDFGTVLANENSDTYADVQFLNSGFVLRSSTDASSYLALNIFANAKPFSHNGTDFAGKEMVVQVCEASGQVLTTSSDCAYGIFTLTDEQFTKFYSGCAKSYDEKTAEPGCFNTNQKFMIEASLDKHKLFVGLAFNDNNSMTNLTTSQGESLVEIDLNQLPHAGLYGSGYVDNQRVGFKMASEMFRLYNISWESVTYGAECWDYPHVMCSFKANYLGGIVPFDSNVTPWVAIAKSSRFGGGNCTIEYHYNGCDMAGSNWDEGLPEECKAGSTGNGYFNIYDGVTGDGWAYWQSQNNRHVYMNDMTKLKSGLYRFNQSGQHHEFCDNCPTGHKNIFEQWDDFQDGYKNSAYVIVNCDNTGEGIGMRYRTDNCNSFWVGDLKQCTEGFDLLEAAQSTYCGASEECIPELSATKFNVRDAELHVSYTNMSYGSNFKVWAVDEHDVKSAVVEVPYSKETGEALISVDQLANDGFNPEALKAIHIVSSSAITITKIESVCPYSMGIGNCKASYNGASWVFTAQIANGDNAKSCTVDNADNAQNTVGTLPSTVDCNTLFETTVSDANLYETVNQNGTAKSYKFTITATNTNNDKFTCTTNEVSIEPIDKACGVSDESVVQGAGTVPDFWYTITNCPEAGCPVTISFENNSSEQAMYKKGGARETFNASSLDAYSGGINGSPALSHGEYTYTLSTLGGQSCTAKFTVEEKRDASAENCRVEGTTFKADITASNYGTVNATLHSADAQGNLIDQIGSSLEITSSTTEFSQPINDVITGPGTYVFILSLDGEPTACTADYLVEGNFKATCPTPLTNQVSGLSIMPGVRADSCNTGCSWWIKDGSETINSGNSYSNGVTYTHSGVDGQTKTYTFGIKHNTSNKTDECTFDVTYRKALNVECPDAMTGMSAGDPISIPAASIEGCEAANSCTWSVSDGMTKAETNYEGSGITFTHSNAIGARTYKYHVTVKRESETRYCDISVGYDPTAILTLTGCSNLTNQTPSQNVSISPTITGCGDACTWTISGAASASGSDISNISFNPGSGTDGQEKAYTLTLSREGAVDVSCPFTVTYKKLGLTCPTPITDQDPSTDITVPLTATGCESNCSLNISGNGVNETKSPYNTGNVTFSHAGRGTKDYTITLSRQNYKPVTCPLSVTFMASGASDISATCSWCEWNNNGQCVDISSTYITKNSAVFKATSFTGYSADHINIYLYDADGNEKGNSQGFYAPNGTYTRSLNDMGLTPNTAGTYTFTLKDEDGYSICPTVDLVVKNPEPNCEVSSNSIEQNKAVTFSVSGTNGWVPGDITYTNLKLYYDEGSTPIKTWSDTYGNTGISYSYPQTTIGSHKFTLKGFDPSITLCEKTITVTKPAPTCAVNDFSVEEGTSSITINLTSTGCTSGPCSYTVTGGTKGGTSGSGYQDSDGSLPNAITGEDAASSTPVPYTLTLTDGDGQEGSCPFEITYTEAGSVTVHEETQTAEYGNATFETGYGEGKYKFTTGLTCVEMQINASGSGNITIGSESYPCSYGVYIARSNPLDVTVPEGCTMSKLYLSSCGANNKYQALPCNSSTSVSTSCPTAPTTAKIFCRGSYDKKIEDVSANQWGDVWYTLGDASAGITVTIETECPASYMPCGVVCSW